MCNTAISWRFLQAALHHSTPTITNDGYAFDVASHKLYVYHFAGLVRPVARASISEL